MFGGQKPATNPTSSLSAVNFTSAMGQFKANTGTGTGIGSSFTMPQAGTGQGQNTLLGGVQNQQQNKFAFPGTTSGTTTGGLGTATTTPTFGGTSTSFFNPTAQTTTQSTLNLGQKPLGQTGSGTSSFLTPQTQTTQPPTQLFQQQPQMMMGNNNYNPQQTTSQLTLLPTNFFKYEKVSSLNPELIKNGFGKIEQDLKTNEIMLEHAESLIKALQENYKVISSEGIKVVKFCKLINSKNTKIKFILENLKNEIDQQNLILEKEKKNYSILEHYKSMKISIPNDYFLTLLKEIEEKMLMQIQQISDIEALINLFYKKEYGTFKINSDLIEELIKEMYACLINLVGEAAAMSEWVIALKNNYVELMRYTYNWKDYEIENRFRNFVQNEENEKLNKQNLY
jgi:hypothetical protein